jgi:hypothetical protein
MELQIENAKFLGDSAYVMTYEDFCARPEYHREQLGKWIPELKRIDFSKELWIKGTKYTKLNDDTEQRIQDLVNDIPDIFNMVNEYFIPKEKILAHWGYKLRYV